MNWPLLLHGELISRGKVISHTRGMAEILKYW